MIGARDLYEAGKFAYENRKELAAFWRWFKKSRLLIIGPGGVGKTTLARILAGEIDWLTSTPWDYSQSYNTEKLKLNKHLQVEMVVAPGQKPRRGDAWRKIQSDLAAGKYRGVILVSAFGFHSIPEAYTAGEYAQVLESLVTSRGSSQFRHETVFASLVIANFKTTQGEVLKKNVAGYDQRMQVESVRRLISVVDSLRAWERQK